jgi:glutaredoxin 3
MIKIILYQFEQCPYCAKVRAKLKEMKVEYETINVEYDRENTLRKELFEKTGVNTVPIMKIDGKFIGDSEKIIAYLDENF